MTGALDGAAPQDIGSPDKIFDYYFAEPQMLFQDPIPPTPGITDLELIEETVGVFDFLLYDDSTNNGFVAITKD